ncbi:ammonium transporter family [Plasmopara halstedii]|uniref:Ammonium transporter family n=1 Tax=Plasmopara halstedii TaxID=4781 RepID=A0A0N7L8L8_PLAHL|nr:ammonium transporter family [Plasmopara halstedii]CEG50235.1 ammonium transporter family [Plasmopara halstedii]|eukprot:XP_024586604.1 ammonium transporter family [Plasmopara halstedii]
MNWHTNLVLLVTLVVGHIFTAAAQNASGSVTTCLVSQYLDDSTGECVNYKDQGEKAQADYGQAVNSGNTAWLLTASAMVMIMTPGVAFFYAGLAGEKMASNTILMSFVSMALVSIQFWAFGYSVAFGSNGMFEWAAYNNVGKTPSGTAQLLETYKVE